MTNLYEDQINIGSYISLGFTSAIAIFGVIQLLYSVFVSRLIYDQGVLFLHIPIRECPKQQKAANRLVDEIRVKERDT
jgi:hypothetical protein